MAVPVGWSATAKLAAYFWPKTNCMRHMLNIRPLALFSNPWRRWYPFLLLAVLCGCSKDRDPAKDYGPFLQQTLDRALQADPQVRNAVLLVESPKLRLNWKGASGLANPAAGTVMTPDQPFRSASIGKHTLAALVLKLSEEGRLSLDDKLEQHLPADIIDDIHVLDGISYGRTITLRQLLNHTSGLDDYFFGFINEADKADGLPYMLELLLDEPDKFWTPLETIAYYKQYLQPRFAPTRGYLYSDTNYQLLGLVVEKVTNLPLHQAYQQWLFAPLQMRDTYVEFYEQPRQAVSHSFFQDVDITNYKSYSADWGGGGLITTTEDLAKFARALANNSYFRRPGTKQAMFTWVPTGEEGSSYGLGTQKMVVAGEELIGHTGATGSVLYYWPAKDVIISYTINQVAPTTNTDETILLPIIQELKK